MLSDSEIMRRVQAGELPLFELLVHRYRDKLLRFAISKLGQSELAEEVVQEAFLAAFQARDSYSSGFAFSTWIWTITLNLCSATAKRRVKQLQRDTAYAHIRQTARQRSMTPSNEAIRREFQQAIYELLEAIPEAEADAIRLRFFGRLKFDEIALAMDSSVSGAKVRVKRGLRRLARMNSERDFYGIDDFEQ